MSENIKDNGAFEWCGYHWSSKMEGGRIIHPDYPHAWYSDSEDVAVRMRNGEMHLYYRENPKTIKFWDGRIFNPTIERAMLRTREHFDYGTFSIEAKISKGLNVGCACWLSGAGNWPPEIDVLEVFTTGGDYLCPFTNHFPWLGKSWRTTYNVHYNDKKIVHRHLGSKNVRVRHQPLDPTENWIKYECVWEPDKITFKANGVVTKTVCSKYARMLTENLKTPEKGYLMDFIIDVNVDDPKILKNRLDEPMKVRNFKYEPLNK
jgi:hypothetical protein